jgi:uncharacterized membrane protein (DUF485 family)
LPRNFGAELRRTQGTTGFSPYPNKSLQVETKFDKSEEAEMDDTAIAKIERDPNYIKLVSERKSFGWTLAIIMLVIYYGYIAIVAFWPSVIAIPLSGSITVGIVLGVAIILAAIILTGIYVLRANTQYDDLTKAIVDAALAGGKTGPMAAAKSAVAAGGKK